MAGRPDVIRQCVFVFLLAWKRISVKRRWLYMWNPSVAKTKLSRLNCDRNVDRVVCYLANRLKSGRMPWGNWLSGETTARNSSSFVRCCLPPEPLTDPLSLMTVSDITTVERFLGTVPGADQSNQTIIINIFYLSSNKTKTNFCFWSGYVLWQISVMTMFWKPALHLTAILITPATSGQYSSYSTLWFGSLATSNKLELANTRKQWTLYKPSLPFGPSLGWPIFARRRCNFPSTEDLIPRGLMVPVRV